MKKGFEKVGEFLCKPETVDGLYKIMMGVPDIKWFHLDLPKDEIKQ